MTPTGSPTREAVYAAIVALCMPFAPPPTLQEIADRAEVNIKTVRHHARQLANAGRITYTFGQPRSIWPMGD